MTTVPRVLDIGEQNALYVFNMPLPVAATVLLLNPNESSEMTDLVERAHAVFHSETHTPITTSDLLAHYNFYQGVLNNIHINRRGDHWDQVKSAIKINDIGECLETNEGLPGLQVVAMALLIQTRQIRDNHPYLNVHDFLGRSLCVTELKSRRFTGFQSLHTNHLRPVCYLTLEALINRSPNQHTLTEDYLRYYVAKYLQENDLSRERSKILRQLSGTKDRNVSPSPPETLELLLKGIDDYILRSYVDQKKLTISYSLYPSGSDISPSSARRIYEENVNMVKSLLKMINSFAFSWSNTVSSNMGSMYNLKNDTEILRKMYTHSRAECYYSRTSRRTRKSN